MRAMFPRETFTERVPWSSADWCAYYRANARALLAIPWDDGADVTDDERAIVASSLPGFQIGESAEGHHLIQKAEAYAQQTGDPDYAEAVRLFIAEEQRHARDMGHFLLLAGVPLSQRSWPDTVFRWVRRRYSLELYVSLALAAEIVGQVYFAALREATGSPTLRRLSEQILRDEVKHVRFQAENLAKMRSGRSRWRIFGSSLFQRFLVRGASLVVWWQHRRVLRAGGVGLRRLWQRCRQEMSVALRQMDPRSYASPANAASEAAEPEPFTASK